MVNGSRDILVYFFQPLVYSSKAIILWVILSLDSEVYNAGKVFAKDQMILLTNSMIWKSDPMGGLQVDRFDHMLFGTVSTF